jgi:hypothetical protein
MTVAEKYRGHGIASRQMVNSFALSLAVRNTRSPITIGED